MISEKTIRTSSKMEILKYSFGGVGSNISFALIMSYLMYFYTDIFGISALSVGSLFLLSRLIDAVTDPIMGMVADRTRSKLGRYRPWIIFATPFLALNIVLMFSTFEMSTGNKIIYAYATYILYSLLSTIVNIPYHSLTPVMSEDSNQRTIIASSKQIMSIPANLFIAVGTLPLVNLFGGGASGWQKFSILAAAVTIISFYMCAWGAKRHDVVSEEDLHNRNTMSFKSQISIITKNKPLLLLMSAFGIQMLALSAANSVNMYYMTYNVGRADLIPMIGLISTLVSLPIAISIPKFAKKIDKKKIFIIGNILSAASGIALFLSPVSNISMVFITSIALTAFGQISSIIGWAMLPDCVDYAQWKIGINGAGTVSSSLTFINKCGMAFGGMIAGALLAGVGYVAGIEQTEIVLSSILILKAMIPAIAYIISSIIIGFYPITNASFEQMISEIKAR